MFRVKSREPELPDPESPCPVANRAAHPGAILWISIVREPLVLLRQGGVDRYGTFHDWPTWRALVTTAGFEELDYFYRPTGLPIEQQPWLASVWRKR